MTSYPTYPVSVTVHSGLDVPVDNAVVLAQLSEALTYHGIIIPDRVVGLTDASGVVVLNLFPNVLVPSPSTHYYISPLISEEEIQIGIYGPNEVPLYHEAIPDPCPHMHGRLFTSSNIKLRVPVASLVVRPVDKSIWENTVVYFRPR